MAHETGGTGIGARLRRKEDARFLAGKGNYVSDIQMPGLMDVAFLRTPVAHARIRGIAKPAGSEASVFVPADLAGIKPMLALSGIPGFKPSEYPALASGKVRFVGEAVAMCLARNRAAAEDLAQAVTLDLDELPPVVDMHAAKRSEAALLHEGWGDNLFLVTHTGDAAKIEAVARAAPVVVKREYRMARQCMSPLEGKGVLAYWDDRHGQLVVVTSTQ